MIADQHFAPHCEQRHPPIRTHASNQTTIQAPHVTTDSSKCRMWFVPLRCTIRLALQVLQNF